MEPVDKSLYRRLRLVGVSGHQHPHALNYLLLWEGAGCSTAVPCCMSSNERHKRKLGMLGERFAGSRLDGLQDLVKKKPVLSFMFWWLF
jgi:hypothetical protein